MMYSSGMWDTGVRAEPLEDALDRKIDRFAASSGAVDGKAVLDVGCGWGYTARRLAVHHDVGRVVGLTPSAAQARLAAECSPDAVEIRRERWEDHQPDLRYDAIVSFGAFEHFAADGTTGLQRIAAYRRFFARCHEWLRPEGCLGLETIAHDDAPDTDAPLGRGPLGDVVLAVYPESLCPHVSEVVLGFEPWFRVDSLESAGADFARTMREWSRRLRAEWDPACDIVGDDQVRAYWQYLVASEVQFRLGTITNLRLVLRRRPQPRW
jgi:cyclopropane-fatty-acyl-phospholipid synthase